MIHSVVSMVAVFVDQMTQAPVVVQCAPVATESWLKWLLPAAVQTVVSLLSIAAGVMIAVWSFRRNRQSEHEQWIRDQKRTEWKEILQATADMENAIPAVAKIQERYDSVAKCLPRKIARLLATRGSCVFVGEVLDLPGSSAAFSDFIRIAAGAAEYLQGFNAQLETNPGVRQSCENKYEEIRVAYLKFCDWLRAEARKDLQESTLSL